MTDPSPRYIALRRNPKLRPPVRWEPLPKSSDVVVIALNGRLP